MTRTGLPIKSCRIVLVSEQRSGETGDGYVKQEKHHRIFGVVGQREREQTGGKMVKLPEQIKDFDDILEHVGSWNRYEEAM